MVSLALETLMIRKRVQLLKLGKFFQGGNMAANRNRRTARKTTSGSNATGIQKQINTDYEYLLRDYKNLGLELWKKPITKFIVSGFSLGIVVSLLGKYTNVNDFASDKLRLIKNKFDDQLDTAE